MPPRGGPASRTRSRRSDLQGAGEAAGGPWPEEELPPEVLTRVLELVEQKQRLGSCALVSRAWQAAATAAATSVALKASTHAPVGGLLAWLHGAGPRQHITSLELEGSRRPLVRPSMVAPLPCRALQRLRLDMCQVHLSAATSGLSRLTHLEVTPECDVVDAQSGGLAALSRLTALSSLMLSVRSEGDAAPLPAGALSRLTQLTACRESGCVVDAEALAGLSRLSGLRRLELGAPDDDDADVGNSQLTPAGVAAVSGLGQLTHLHLRTIGNVDACRTPGLSSMTALRHLSITGCECQGVWRVRVSAALLAGFQHLQGLRLDKMVLHPADAPQLLALAACQPLTSLELEGVGSGVPHDGTGDGRAMGAPLCAGNSKSYAALTASSALQRLVLCDTSLPKGSAAAMFGAGRQLTALTKLVMGTLGAAVVNTARGVRRIVDSAPQLVKLCLRGCVAPGTAWSALPGLQQLRDLSLARMSDKDMAYVTQLTGLRTAIFTPPNEVYLDGMGPLTKLHSLEMVVVMDGEDAAGARFAYINKAPKGAPPDVWQQIATLWDYWEPGEDFMFMDY